MTPRSMLLNSAAAFAVACLVMVTLHEAAHTVAAVAQGNSPEMFGFSVDDASRTDRQNVITALAGPIFGLASGVLVLALPLGGLPGFWRLSVIWFGLLSVQEFSGYLVTGPFAHVGDIGSVLQVTGAPAIVGWLGFVLGWAITYVLGRHAVRRLSEFASTQAPLGPQLRALGLFAWLLGAVIVIVLSLDLLTAGGVSFGVVAFEALGVVSSGVFLIFVRLFLPAAQPRDHPPALGAAPVAGLIVLVVVAVARQLLLRDGITF